MPVIGRWLLLRGDPLCWFIMRKTDKKDKIQWSLIYLFFFLFTMKLTVCLPYLPSLNLYNCRSCMLPLKAVCSRTKCSCLVLLSVEIPLM